MKKQIRILVTGAVIAGVVVSLVGLNVTSQAAPGPMARKIVVFQSWFVHEEAQDELVAYAGGFKIKNLDLINGMAVYLPSKASEKALENRSEILRVDNDDEVFALGKPSCPCNNSGTCEPELGEHPSCCDDCKGNGEEEPTPQPEETTAWGVDRIDADLAWDKSTGTGVKVAIIDSGIDKDHLDLTANIQDGYNAINPKKSWDDDYGHGTHVAGIVAAVDNEIGVIGTAPNVWLYAVKVLNRRGIGFTSDVIDGLDWCINHGIQVANMSIGSSGCSQSYKDAIISAYNAGITIAAAAGNNGETGGDLVCPGNLPETIAVSATCNANCPGDKYSCSSPDALAPFSSYASTVSQAEEVNLIAAPGQAINSTWNDGFYHEGNGTSMATPHVTGTVALVLKAKGCITPNQTGCTPAEIMEVLETTAEDLTPAEIDPYYGYGLVDAEKAVQ